MAPFKFTVKCGSFAVLVDLHVLPLGAEESTSWFTAGQVKEVSSLVRGPVDQRVKQYTEFLQSRRQQKQKKELAPASAFILEGENFHLVANFLKRHSNLRCVVKQDLRMFPERYVVCVSCPEDALAHHGNPSPAAMEKEQTRSKYFSSVGETQELLHNPTKTKKAVLQKITKEASVQQEKEQMDQRASVKSQKLELKAAESESSLEVTPRSEPEERNHTVPLSCASTESEAEMRSAQEPEAEHEIVPKSNKRCKPGDDGYDASLQRTKRVCHGRPPASKSSTQTSIHDLPPLLPLPSVQVKTKSKAFPALECEKTSLEVELLTPGKQAQRLPLTSNNTAQTIQNRPAASLRGLSVRPASSGSSIGSRSTVGEEGSENVPRTSRLRRMKRS
ncbi:protein SLX4IP [Nothobranchius furzeri]